MRLPPIPGSAQRLERKAATKTTALKRMGRQMPQRLMARPRPKNAAAVAASQQVPLAPKVAPVAKDRVNLAEWGCPGMTREPVIAYVALGANLGDAAGALREAAQALARTAGISGLRCSRLYRSAPVDASGPDFINAVAELRTVLTAPDLLDALQAIETHAGRLRPYRHAPRTLDLDLLLYGSGRVASPRLTVPHPRMWRRAFVLVPLAEIAPQLVSAGQLAAVAEQAIEPLEV